MIELATLSDLDIFCQILEEDKASMKSHGVDQWQNGYPNREALITDISLNRLYVYKDNEEVLGFCALIKGIEPTYLEIEGEWLNDAPYLTIHRFATYLSRKKKDTAVRFLTEIEELHLADNIRVDTHKDNLPMNNLLKKCGYHYCGIITLLDGAEHGAKRNAYQKVL